ncbi:E3 ubiquitin-protein ligase Praja-2 isoform X2 [Ascaphus truei]|uniref:E3 ubiquitin-protein ligase Praja-2 isoform X2 n=1 Tax=Ascaphus truei TaxID=8439 RepID=UPI003F5AB694
MGQEACKAACPKPAGGYQTITGRRYGRRHAYVSFRPSLESPNRMPSQQNRDCEGLELDDVQKENHLFSKESCDSSICSVGRDLIADFQHENMKPEGNDRTSVVIEAERNALFHFSVPGNTKGYQTLGNSNDCKKITKALLRHAPVEQTRLPRQNGISFVNIDSFEPDSSDGEENDCLSEDFSIAEEAGKLQKTLDSMLLELEKEVDSLSETQSDLSSVNNSYPMDSLAEVWPVSLVKHSNVDLGPTQSKRNVATRPVPADQATEIASLGLCESQQKKNKIDVPVKTTVGRWHEINASDVKADQGNLSEPVVRPKIRKQASANQCNKTSSHIFEDEEKENANAGRGNRESRVHLEKTCRDEKSHYDMVFDPINFEGARKKIKGASKEWENSTVQEDKPVMDDTFWDDFEVYGMNLAGSNKAEDSSDCSDGEWSTCLPSYFSTDKDHSSSDDSWETLPGKEEHEAEIQSTSSSLEEENSDFCFQVEDQTSLEEGEIPWLQYHEDIESSTDEENEIGSQFVHPGFFMLDDNNNLEDDSSMSEDLEVEWRLLDDFGDGLGVAQAMSYVDPQFLTYMALEERLAQAMETALAHLESLAVDVEQAHPPASKQSIDCLPQIVITEDHNGQEQCCAICCSEYSKDEILTELPCHHLFHKPCVTLWLQKSGTCPVCRHVLVPLLPEAAATSFLSDHESPPSIHSAAGTR